MAVTPVRNSRIRDDYLDLVKRFPLRPLKDDNEHAEAVEIVQELLTRKLTSGEGQYLDGLIVFVTKYEDELPAIDTDTVTPQEALRFLMESNGLSQAQIARIAGASVSAVSMFLSGTRGLSKPAIKALAERFKVSADVFF